MKTIHTEIEILAPASTVWRVLTDFSKYPSWNPFVTSVDGALSVGDQLCVTLSQPSGNTMKFKPIVEVIEPGKKFSWQGQLLFKGIFDGFHEFCIEPINNTKVRFIHREAFSGVLLRMLWSSLENPTKAGFESMNKALKVRSELVEKVKASGHAS